MHSWILPSHTFAQHYGTGHSWSCNSHTSQRASSELRTPVSMRKWAGLISFLFPEATRGSHNLVFPYSAGGHRLTHWQARIKQLLWARLSEYKMSNTKLWINVKLINLASLIHFSAWWYILPEMADSTIHRIKISDHKEIQSLEVLCKEGRGQRKERREEPERTNLMISVKISSFLLEVTNSALTQYHVLLLFVLVLIIERIFFLFIFNFEEPGLPLWLSW